MLSSWWGRGGGGGGSIRGRKEHTEWMNINEETHYLPNLLIGVSEVIPPSLPSLLRNFNYPWGCFSPPLTTRRESENSHRK